MRIPITPQFYVSDAKQFSSSRLVNMYYEQAPKTGETHSPYVIQNLPGATERVDLEVGNIKGMHSRNNVLYVVTDTDFYSIDTSWNATTVSTSLSNDSTFVDIIENDTQLMLAGGTNGYVYTLSTATIAAITDGDFPGASSAAFLDGYGIVSKPNDQQLNLSQSGNFTAWDALDFVNESSQADDVVAVRSDKRELWVFGEQSVVPYQRTGVGNFPFERIGSAIIDVALESSASAIVVGGVYMWLGFREKEGGLGVYMSVGYQAQKVSTPAIDRKLQGLSNTNQAIAWSFAQNGHEFYVLTINTEATLVFDLSTGLWCEWQRINLDYVPYTHHAYFNGFNVVGTSDGKILSLDDQVYKDDSNTIQRKIITPVYSGDGNPIYIGELELEVEAGVGLNTGQGSNPQVMMRFSRDGGRTWSNEYWRSPGKVGEYKDRCFWKNLGTAREWVFEFTISDPVKTKIFGIYADLYGGEYGP